MNSKCSICGSTTGKHPKTLNLHRWVQEPNRGAMGPKEQKLSLVFPICDNCSHSVHSQKELIEKFALIASIFLFIVITWGFIQKEAFSNNLLGGLILFVICIGVGVGITYIGYDLFTAEIFDDAFSPSCKEEPYKSLSIVKYVVDNGFVDEDDYKVIKADSPNYVPLPEILDKVKDFIGDKTNQPHAK